MEGLYHELRRRSSEAARAMVRKILQSNGGDVSKTGLQAPLWKRDGRQDTFRSPPFTSKLVPMSMPVTLYCSISVCPGLPKDQPL